MANKKDDVVLDETTQVEEKTEVVEEIDSAEVEEKTTDEEEELSPWYYFFSVGCGFCKKVEPIIEELNNEGHDILFLDMAEPENQELNKELQQEYGKRCGTPWFINADTGEAVCGYREKDVLLKWLSGEKIPEPPRLKSQMPKIPFMGSSEEEETKWAESYQKCLEENQHMGDDFIKRQKSSDEILGNPRPKSDPPKPPIGAALQNASDEEIDKWGEEMKVWAEENNHLPNLQPIANMINNIKGRSCLLYTSPSPRDRG